MTQAPSGLTMIRGDGSRRAIHPADAPGRFLRRRRVAFVLLIGFLVALPLVHVGGGPAVQLDIDARRFRLFGEVYNAQDVWIAVFAILAWAFGLLFSTAWLGRAWCGWACPQTVLLEALYRPIERLIDGPWRKRQRLDAAPLGPGKILRRLIKHALYLAASLGLVLAFLALFVPDLWRKLGEGPAARAELWAWAAALTALVHLDLGWFREQLCIVVCPYGRLQAALVDKDSLVVGFDERRQDCIDCGQCARVCPTGIDIRNGLQLECIACLQCVDACDDVMRKIKRPEGLVRIDTTRHLQGGRHRILRGRLVAYGVLLAASLGALGWSLATRTPFEAAVLRPPGMPFQAADDAVRNLVDVYLTNKRPEEARLRLAVQAGAAEVRGPSEVRLPPYGSERIKVLLLVPRAAYRGPFPIRFELDDGAGTRKALDARFLGPPG